MSLTFLTTALFWSKILPFNVRFSNKVLTLYSGLLKNISGHHNRAFQRPENSSHRWSHETVRGYISRSERLASCASPTTTPAVLTVTLCSKWTLLCASPDNVVAFALAHTIGKQFFAPLRRAGRNRR